MKSTRLAFAALTLLLPTTTLPAYADIGITVPGLTKIGQCVSTTIKTVSGRLTEKMGPDDGGDQVAYADGTYGVSYDVVPALHTARAGDKVTLCLTSLPKDCPAGDERGKTYRALDLRTHKAWELPDSEHMCGGA
jgi:hypothetical protein